MKTIGGFLPLEIPEAPRRERCHAGAAALSSGRGCFHQILRTVRPRRVLLPFYICDALLAPLAAAGTPHEFYAIDEAFEPAAPLDPADGELAVVVNYFGVLSDASARESARLGARGAVDDTQAFFRRGSSDRWSFNSARKFFGVPDGAFLYGPFDGAGDLPPSESGDCDHLVARLGDDARAWDLFKAHERRIDVEPRRISAASARLLAAVDMECARRRREANFLFLHESLGADNAVALPLAGAAAGGPMCYPFLARAEVDRDRLARDGVFVPALWPEVAARGGGEFAWERQVARRLLPLPIDHRYGAAEMETLTGRLRQVIG